MKPYVASAAVFVGALLVGGCGGQVLLGSGNDGGGDGAGGGGGGDAGGGGDDGGFGGDAGGGGDDGGQLDGGQGDAGSWSPGTVAASYNAALVENARQLCAFGDPSSTDDTYSQSDILSHLVGGWMLCDYSDLNDAVSYEFTSDGQWETLEADGTGGLIAGQPGVEGGPPETHGAYTVLDRQGNPAGSGNSIVYIGRDGATWFHPEFALGPRTLWMYVATSGSLEMYVQLGQ